MPFWIPFASFFFLPVFWLERRHRVRHLVGPSLRRLPLAPSLLFAGYAPKYKQVENAIKAKYPKTECKGEPTPTNSGAFEVKVDGELVHSKLTMGSGFVDSPAKLEKILEAIGKAA